jgi:hypothetical protein
MKSRKTALLRLTQASKLFLKFQHLNQLILEELSIVLIFVTFRKNYSNNKYQQSDSLAIANTKEVSKNLYTLQLIKKLGQNYQPAFATMEQRQ